MAAPCQFADFVQVDHTGHGDSNWYGKFKNDGSWRSCWHLCLQKAMCFSLGLHWMSKPFFPRQMSDPNTIKYTLPETNSEFSPENGWFFRWSFPFQGPASWQVRFVSFREGISLNWLIGRWSSQIQWLSSSQKNRWFHIQAVRLSSKYGDSQASKSFP